MISSLYTHCVYRILYITLLLEKFILLDTFLDDTTITGILKLLLLQIPDPGDGIVLYCSSREVGCLCNNKKTDRDSYSTVYTILTANTQKIE